jgi:hypothetical protein
MTETLSLLENWYAARCDGVWEHQRGIRIRTLDNPGWSLEIDLNGTKAESRSLDVVKLSRTESDWIHYWVEKKKFFARMGPVNLTETIGIFCRWFADSD